MLGIEKIKPKLINISSPPNCSRIGPIHFQPIEKELMPVLKYLKGHVLNAGCGNRDLSSFLLNHGAVSLDNCDLDSSIPKAIICDLTEIPRAANTYDSILCNAVLEHVQFPDLVLKELHRLLKPAGFLVLCVPFLQPYHPCPTDFQRYTREGMSELGQRYNFEMLEIFPVHSIAQTVSWIVWSYLEEKNKRLIRRIIWLPFYLWTRISMETDFSLINNANTYQIVLKKKT